MIYRKIFKQINAQGRLFFLCLLALPLYAEKLDGIVAQVGSGIILQSELDRQMTHSQQTQEQALNTLIEQKLQLEIAQKMGLTVTNSRLDQTIARLAQAQQRSVPEYLQDQATSLKLSVAEVREQIKKELLFNLVRQHQVGSRIIIADKEINHMAQTIRERHTDQTEYLIAQIRIKLPENELSPEQVAQATRQLEDIKQQISNKKATFDTLARQYSDDESASNGGSRGWQKKQHIPSLILDALQHANIGEVVGPIQSPVGLHLFILQDKRNDLLVQQQEYKVRHILLKPSIILESKQAQKRLQNYKKQIEQHRTTFADMAKKHSQDISTRDSGGDLGWVTPDSLDPNFAQALTRLSVGKVSSPVQSAFGWHLILLDDKRTLDITEQALYKRAKEILFAQRMEEEVPNWLNTLRNEQHVHIFLQSTS